MRLLIFILSATITLFITVNASSNKYRFETWSVDEGLPYKTVNSVLQTRDGYIWTATSDGLARFDGVRFTVFNTANTQGLITNRLGTLADKVRLSEFL